MDFQNEKEKLAELATLMNEQSETPMMVTDELLYVMDAALLPEEVDFLLAMGGGRQPRHRVVAKVHLSGEDFDRILENLLDKGQITELKPEPGEEAPVLHLMSIFPGWFEVFLMRGSETPDRREFSVRLSNFFDGARAIPAEILNAVVRETAPHRSIAVANPAEPQLIAIGETVQPLVNEIHPAHSIMKILADLDEKDTIAIGHCFCRQQRRMTGDPCRLHISEPSCMSLGAAAEHVLARGIGRRITKQEAIDLIKELEKKGAVHQVGRLVPLKDFRKTHEADVICNCCWDCCGAFGNYARGNIPFFLKAYYVAEMIEGKECNECGECEFYCPVGAITLTDDGVAGVNRDLCCGCGLCVSHCSEQAIRLQPFERDVFLPVLEPSQRRIA